MRTIGAGHEEGFDRLIARHSIEAIEADHRPSVQDQLADLGVPDESADAVMALIEEEAQHRGFGYAAGTIRRILAFAAGRSVAGAALAHAFGFGEEKSLDELAGLFACSKQAVDQAKKRLLAIVGPILPSAPYRTPTRSATPPPSPGEWLKLTEAARVAGVNVGVIRNAARIGELAHTEHCHQYWILEPDAVAWGEAYHARIAARGQLKAARDGRTHEAATAAVTAAATMDETGETEA